MTISPRFWTDPRSGLEYPFGAKLPSANVNEYVSGLKALDSSVERMLACNWPYSYQKVTAELPKCCCWSPTYQLWVGATQSGANPQIVRGWPHLDAYETVTLQPAAEEGLTNKDIVGFGGYVVLCGDPGSSSHHKYRYSANGGDSWSSGNSAITSTTSVNAVTHHYTTGGAISLFVSGAEGGVIETSPTGATWTQRTAANANDVSAMGSNGIVVVAVSSASTNKCVTSANCADWTERTMTTTAAWYDVCWCGNQGYWVAVGINGSDLLVFNKSTDGITWSSVEVLSGLDLSYVLPKMVSTGNALVLTASGRVFASFDLAANWRIVYPNPSNILGYIRDIAVAVDPDDRSAQTLYVAETTGGDAYYAASFCAS